MAVRYRAASPTVGLIAAVLAIAPGATGAWAQTPTERPPRQGPADQCFSGGPSSPPGPPAGDPQARNPSEQLSQSGGIVCPPAGVDPEMSRQAPNVGRTPVITPPGGPGSPVQPK